MFDLPIKFLRILCPNESQKATFILQEKFAKFELGHPKIVLDGCSSILEYFLVNTCIFIFTTINDIFNTWIREYMEKIINWNYK